ncbi:hypothetical protein A4A49_30954 [Nicotiana attenuata]|uniref:RNase H type-1 domain-containing protein n=1 Tax=Nicotiana attenuata TaxID=49451 RepID=A0A314LDG1_NICAT|nr:hypothetical protein A4A49_30954 [Nicotiana attenuata]
MEMPNKPDRHSHEEQRLNETQLQNHQAANQDQRAKARTGIVINEPTEVQKIPMMEEVPGKGKKKLDDKTTRNNNQKIGQNINKKKRFRVRKKNQNSNSNEVQFQNTILEKGQPSNKGADTKHKSSEQKASNKEDTITPLDNDQNSRHSFQRNFTNDKDTTKYTDEEANSRKGTESNNNKNNQLIDPGNVHNTYLKLISGTSLEEDQEREDMYIANNIHMAESSFEDDAEEDSTEDGSYEDEMSTKESDEFESVDSESFQNEEQPINHIIDEHAAQLIETFNSNALVEESDQQFTCSIDWMGTNILVTSIYAKCEAGLREQLWSNLRDVSQNYKLPCKGNPGSAGGGGLIRDHNGVLIGAFAEFYGDCSCNIAEAKAMRRGIKMYITNGLTNVIVEYDSAIILNLIKRTRKPPWRFNNNIEQIQTMTKHRNFVFCHTLREGNNSADKLANLGEESKIVSIFNEVVSLPLNVRASMKLEVDGIPNFRFRQKKNKFVINDSTYQ